MAKRIASTLSIMEVLSLFATEADAVKWFEDVRWKGTPTCTHCGNTENLSRPKSRPDAYWCSACQQRFTVRMGTVMESSRISLQKWAVAMYYSLTARKGISSLQLSKELKVTQKTAWFLLQRIREACEYEGLKLENIVEVDETYIGGKAKNKHQDKKPKNLRGTEGKQAVFGMRQRGGKTVAKPVSGTDRKTLVSEIEQTIEPGSVLCTDDHGAYRELDPAKYYHDSVNHSMGEYVKGFVHTNSIESVWAVLKRALTGTYHHVSFKHLYRYMNEVTFRLNEGNCEVDTIDRMRALGRGLLGKRLTYRRLIHG